MDNDASRAEVYERLKTYLAELFERGDVHEDDNGHFYVRFGSTVLEIAVEPYSDTDEVMIMVMAYCVQQVETDEELLRELLELNHSLPFGSFSLVGNDIFFHHALFGRSLERPALLNALQAVATISDDHDDRIADKYGGRRALDRIRDTGGRQRRKQMSTAIH